MSYYLYNTIFWISRFITLFIFGIFSFTVLNVKFLFIEKYFYFIIIYIGKIARYLQENIVVVINNLIKFNIDISCMNFNFYWGIYKTFCKNSSNIYILLIAFISVILMYVFINKTTSKKYSFISVLIIYILAYYIFNLLIMLMLALTTIISLMLIKQLENIKNKKIFMAIPIIGEICCINDILIYIFKKDLNKYRKINLLIISLILSNIICFFIPINKNESLKNLISNKSTYSIRYYENKMLISSQQHSFIVVNRKNKYKIYNIDELKKEELEDFVVNDKKKEIYLCKGLMLYILDLNTFNIINEINLEKYRIKDKHSRVCCNNDFTKLLIVPENDKHICLLDLETKNIFEKKIDYYKNDWVIYNKYRKCFLLSFYETYTSYLKEIRMTDNLIYDFNIKSEICQGYSTISDKNMEIYVAFNQQGKIGVYDVRTMKLKRKIKSNYTVKNITYDEDLNVLIAPSYLMGYVDIFLMDGSDTLLTREFVGYELREAGFDIKKENLYVCSKAGLYKIPINIKKLIEKYKDVSRETRNGNL